MVNLFILAALLLCSAFFSGSETALFSLSKIRVRRLQVENVKNARTLAYLLNRPRTLIITILTGNMLVNILASSMASSIALKLFGDRGLGISIGIMTLLILTFGEITPKVISIKNSERISLFVAPYILFFSRLVLPLRKILGYIVDFLEPIASRKIKRDQEDLNEEEVKKAVEIGTRFGALDKKEEEMIRGVFKFNDKTARDVIVPPQRIVAVDISTPLDTIRSIITKKELSRMPIFENNLDNIVGMLYAKDLIVAGQKGEFALRDILRKPFYVAEDINLDDLLREFRKHRIHMALVKNKGGRLAGLVTLQDLLEEIIGQIRDIKEQSP
ncbi:MAG: HlyC/CorC family transporter [Candidatus Omnitrophica bacterium]|nr:HlyC/CorC family transporter [Candidatus Omnitrophota bacterium]